MMKTKILYLVLIFALTSCDPGYRVIIFNRSSEEYYIKTNPPIEDLYAFKSLQYASIIARKIDSSKSEGLYRVKSKDKLPLYNYIGKPSEKYFPFNYIKVITKNDTLIIDNKNLLKNINKKQKGNDYFIELN